jgi:pre-mRNA-splicing factor CWC22
MLQGHPATIEGLDLIEEEDQITHTLSLEEAQNPENELSSFCLIFTIIIIVCCADVFRVDPEFEKNEDMYTEIRREILGDSDDENDSDNEGDDDEGEETPNSWVFLLISISIILCSRHNNCAG